MSAAEATELFVEHGPKGAEIVKTAVISADGLYRYELTRSWGDGPRMTFVMLNPSTADAEQDDPTIRRCMGFARREGCGGIVVVNLFALRVTRPVHLFDGTIAEDPEGRENCSHVGEAIRHADDGFIVAAWGAITPARAQRSFTWRQLRARRFEGWLRCLGKTADGSPRHPLYLKSDAPLEVWS